MDSIRAPRYALHPECYSVNPFRHFQALFNPTFLWQVARDIFA